MDGSDGRLEQRRSAQQAQRQSRLARIRRRIADGHYDSPAVREIVMTRLLVSGALRPPQLRRG